MSRALAAYRVGSHAARLVPHRLVGPLSRLAGGGTSRVLVDRRRMVARHLARAGDPSPGAPTRAFASYARYWIESLRLPHLDDAHLDIGLDYEGYGNIVASRANGIGPIVALPHLGGWEWAAFWLHRVEGAPVSAVVEKLEPQDLYEWFVGFRERLGIEVIGLDGAAAAASMRALRANRILCLLCDRDIGGTGVEVEFFGERTTLPAGPITLALRTGAPVLPTAVYFKDDRHHCKVGAALELDRQGRLRDDVARLTQRLAHSLEELIRHAPDQWHLMQPNWPSDAETRR